MNIIYDMLEWGGDNNDPSKIVIHSMGESINNNGDIYEARDWLDFLKLSSHYLIKPDGDVIQCRANGQTAYHARGFNKNSIGIEFLVPGTHDYGTFIRAIESDWVQPEQYETGIELCRDLINEFGDMMIVRHSDLSPGRKVDPGKGFRWQEFKQKINDDYT